MYPGNFAKHEAAIRNSAAAVVCGTYIHTLTLVQARLGCNPSLIRKLQHQPHFRPSGRREPPRHEGQAHKRAHRRHRRHEGGRVIRRSGRGNRRGLVSEEGPAVADEFRADPLEHLCRGRGRGDGSQRGRKGWVRAGLEREGDVCARERGGGQAEDSAVRGDGGGLEHRAAHAYIDIVSLAERSEHSAEAHPKLVSSSGDAPQMYALNAKKSTLNPALRAITLRIGFPAASKGPVGLNPSTVPPEPACAPHCSSARPLSPHWKAFAVERHRKAERRSLRNGGMWGWSRRS
ncbi:hypothetical protein B0H16DRAFT_1572495 [Mycena metata]|uniref:Uncharacterized protein n=1 Tax=Mycena metata TaxID=1033252 RepID=A0AAD7I7Y2_9AGAR|nr:hypothetical protein B0H16DRAFT_1572495 [Mycena metata]